MKSTSGRPYRRTGQITAAIALTAGLTACAAGNTASSGAGSQGVTDKSIKIGGVLTKTSATGYSTAEAEIGARARFARANATGGVDGRKIDFIGTEDDGFDAGKGMTAAKKLVQKDGVFALVPVSAPVFGGATFLDQQKVPFFGWATGPQWCGVKAAFGYNGCLAPKPGSGSQTWWGNQVAAQIGGASGRAAFVQGSDDSGSKYGVTTIGHSFAAAGFTLAGSSAAIPTAAPPSDYLPYVNKIMTSNKGGPPDVVVSVMASPKVNAGLYGALRKAGYKGVVSDATSYDPKLLAVPALAKALDGVLTAPMFEPFESDIPEVAQLKADIRKVAPSTTVFTQSMAIGYWSADIFLKVAERAGKNLTRDSFAKAADGFSYSNPGFGKIEYPKDQSEPNGCGALVKLTGGAFQVVQHLRCFDNAALK